MMRGGERAAKKGGSGGGPLRRAWLWLQTPHDVDPSVVSALWFGAGSTEPLEGPHGGGDGSGEGLSHQFAEYMSADADDDGGGCGIRLDSAFSHSYASLLGDLDAMHSMLLSLTEWQARGGEGGF